MCTLCVQYSSEYILLGSNLNRMSHQMIITSMWYQKQYYSFHYNFNQQPKIPLGGSSFN